MEDLADSFVETNLDFNDKIATILTDSLKNYSITLCKN